VTSSLGRFILLLGEWPQVFKKKSNDFRVVASRVEGEKVLVASTRDHPQPFWLDGCTEQFFGLSECCVLVTAILLPQGPVSQGANRANRLEVAGRDVQPWAELDEQERREYGRERSISDADPVLDGARNARIHGLENHRVEAGWLRAK
jgi:hypothetical protein